MIDEADNMSGAKLLFRSNKLGHKIKGVFCEDLKNNGSYKNTGLELLVRHMLIVVSMKFYGITAHHTKIYYDSKRGPSVAPVCHKRSKASTP